MEEKAEDEEEFVEEEESQFDLITDRRIAEGLRQVDHVKEFEARKGENGISLEVVTICGADEVGVGRRGISYFVFRVAECCVGEGRSAKASGL